MPASAPILSSKLFIILSILTGLVGSFIYPLMSFFLVDGLQLQPMYIGIYMVSVTMSGLVITQLLGGLADKGYSARLMYIIANLGIILALVVYMNSTWFVPVLIAGVCFMSFGNASMPQMLTLSRQWANNNTVDITQFNARIRAGCSFAWMMGPPLAFSLVATVGFSGTFGMAILVSSVGIVFVWKMLPEQPSTPKKLTHDKPAKVPLYFWFLATSIVLGSIANNMYSTSLPLYTIKELKLPSYTPGLLMGMVAGLEIIIMLWSTRLSRRFSKKSLMLVAFCFGFVFYAGIFNASALWHFVLLQFLNAMFYGLFAGISLTLMQEQLPERIGFTTAVYANGFKVGVMIGASATGLIAQFLSFRHATIGAMLAAILGIVSLMLFSYYQKKYTLKINSAS